MRERRNKDDIPEDYKKNRRRELDDYFQKTLIKDGKDGKRQN